MPLYRYGLLDDGKWGSARLNHEAYILHRPTNNTMMLDRLGKITRHVSASTFPKNDGTVLVHAICSAKEVSSPSGGATGTAVARVAQQAEVEQYVGRVKSFDGDDVIAEVGPADDMDRWDVIIPRAAFDEEPEVDQKIACKISRQGSHAEIAVQMRRNHRLPELKDFGIDKEKLLSWASQLDV
jgi:hypothetical protein